MNLDVEWSKSIMIRNWNGNILCWLIPGHYDLRIIVGTATMYV